MTYRIKQSSGCILERNISYTKLSMVFLICTFLPFTVQDRSVFFLFSSFCSPSLLQCETFSCNNRAQFFLLSLIICRATLQGPESAAWLCFDASDTFLHAKLHCVARNQGILFRTPLTPHPNFSAFRLDCQMSICLELAGTLQAHQSTAMLPKSC